MDGTLVDSEHHWFHGMSALAAEHHVPWTETDSLACVGLALLDTADRMRAKGLDLPATEIVDLLVDYVASCLAEKIEWRDGAVEILSTLADAGVPCALVTMSYRKIAQQVVDAAPASTLRVLVTGDDVTHGKPHPEPYLTAAALLGVDPRECVAVEDSVTGITSAEAAGTHGVVVRGLTPVPAGPGRSFVSDLTLLDLDGLRAVISGEVLDLRGPT
ncbi:HAD family phosphatase [Nakamurella silvestris]|nr:HAD family phosphatase [Nakamurella silvestris]